MTTCRSNGETFVETALLMVKTGSVGLRFGNKANARLNYSCAEQCSRRRRFRAFLEAEKTTRDSRKGEMHMWCLCDTESRGGNET